ncbi:MAG: hypothetical protein GX239_03635, partial [Clostridiaceae bacterium]|nr:hypothetical protein [Clostridiaceae bacterium]
TVTPEGYLRADPIHVELTPGAQSIRVQTETKHLINEKQTYQFVFTKSFEESSGLIIIPRQRDPHILDYLLNCP